LKPTNAFPSKLKGFEVVRISQPATNEDKAVGERRLVISGDWYRKACLTGWWLT
jgi:hypothetical protein